MKKFPVANLLSVSIAVILSVLFAITSAEAASTVGLNLQTDGTLSVTATSTLGAAFIGTPISGPSAGGFNPGLTITSNSLPYSILEIHNKYAAAIDMYTHDDAEFRAPYVNFYKSRGTQGSPTPVESTGYELDSIGGINFGGWDGANYVASASILTQSDENWTSVGNHHAGHISIYATQIGSNTDRQFAQFGGLDGVDLNAQNRNGVTGNIVFYAGLAFSGNQSGNPAIFALSNPGVLEIRNALNTADAGLTAGTITTSGKIGVSTSTPIANFQVANGTNATTTMELGSAGQNKGSCLKLYRTDGSAIYAYVGAGATTFTLTTISCANISNF